MDRKRVTDQDRGFKTSLADLTGSVCLVEVFEFEKQWRRLKGKRDERQLVDSSATCEENIDEHQRGWVTCKAAAVPLKDNPDKHYMKLHMKFYKTSMRACKQAS